MAAAEGKALVAIGPGGTGITMTLNTLRLVLSMASLSGVLILHSMAAAASIRPAMQGVVTCVYNMVRSKPGVLEVNVYDAGTGMYVIE